jgi:hypothetical protein
MLNVIVFGVYFVELFALKESRKPKAESQKRKPKPNAESEAPYLEALGFRL